MRYNIKKKPIFSGKETEREENCTICNEKRGLIIGTVDYWDIKTSHLVRCSNCNHIQLDPMLTDEETAKGCYAYYIEETLRTSAHEQQRNCVRNFRRGVIFGHSLKRKKISPRSVLELGPGSGYFLAGLQFVFPNIEITVMDINEEILNFNKNHHHYKTILAVPDIFAPECESKFDLIIGRDILEHVSNVSNVISNVQKYLIVGGHFHFITPNGHEDVWKHYLTHLIAKMPSELLINHVNYFDGRGLNNLLQKNGLIPIQYYTYRIKTTLKGRGWKISKKGMSSVSKKKNANLFIHKKVHEIDVKEVVKSDLLNQWYIRKEAPWLTYIYSIYQHGNIFKINPNRNIGHEIFGLFRKM